MGGRKDFRGDLPDDAALEVALRAKWLRRPAGSTAPDTVATARVVRHTVKQVLMLYREEYVNFNARHFHKKLKEEHGIGVQLIYD